MINNAFKVFEVLKVILSSTNINGTLVIESYSFSAIRTRWFIYNDPNTRVNYMQ